MVRSSVGIVGGGQLARMTAEAGASMNVAIVVLERQAQSPAGQIVGSKNEIVGDWRDFAILQSLASRVDVVTLENEFVDADQLSILESAGHRVLPTPRSIALVQDKLIQKETLAAANVPIAPFRGVSNPDDAIRAAETLGWPLVLKTRRNGYDGYGNQTVHDAEELRIGWDRLTSGTSAGDSGGLLVEAFQPFERELAVMVARAVNGAVAIYPVADTVQKDHICHEVIVPSDAARDVTRQAARIAQSAVEAIGLVGIVGVELFALPDGQVLVNELAPRPHNSGHYTIEGCATSQFENHLRAILGLPLGLTKLVAPSVSMVNLLGNAEGIANPSGLDVATSVPEAYLHLYGKRDVRPGRKMGHVTATGPTRAVALGRARQAARAIGWPV